MWKTVWKSGKPIWLFSLEKSSRARRGSSAGARSFLYGDSREKITASGKMMEPFFVKIVQEVSTGYGWIKGL